MRVVAEGKEWVEKWVWSEVEPGQRNGAAGRQAEDAVSLGGKKAETERSQGRRSESDSLAPPEGKGKGKGEEDEAVHFRGNPGGREVLCKEPVEREPGALGRWGHPSEGEDGHPAGTREG